MVRGPRPRVAPWHTGPHARLDPVAAFPSENMAPHESSPDLDPRLTAALSEWRTALFEWNGGAGSRAAVSGRGETALARLRGRVGEAAAWCAEQLTSERTAGVLRPQRLSPEPSLYGSPGATVESVVQRRAGDWSAPLGSLDRSGGILCMVPERAPLADGRIQRASAGFFDVWGVPPSGTWIALLEGPAAAMLLEGRGPAVVLSWVPGTYRGAVDRCLAEAGTRSLYWLRDAAAPLAELDALLTGRTPRSDAGRSAGTSAPEWLRRLPLLDRMRGV